MFQSLTDKLSAAFRKFRGKGKLTEADVRAGMREIKLALLEADVSFRVVKEFINRVSERAVGSEVLESLLPAQQIVKIVNEELTEIMGSSQSKLTVSPSPPTVIMMCGLQGAGKTTHAAKLAAMYKKQGKRPMLAACDVYRPAAVKQLEVLGEQIGVPVFSMGTGVSPVEIAKRCLAAAKDRFCDMLFMEELRQIKAETSPDEILLTVDAMIGQDAVNVAEKFNELLDITGVILTKLDGDTRGGAALSVRYITGKPIKFIGTGEKIENIEPFYPDRMASRILGMGDILTLIEKAEQAYDEKQAAELERKVREASFTLDDYLEQFGQLKNMGDLDQLLGLMPGIDRSALKGAHVDEKAVARTEAIIKSMTPAERARPEILNYSRKQRVAAGSGTSIQEVNRLLKQFEQTQKLMKQFSSGGRGFGKNKKRGMTRFPF